MQKVAWQTLRAAAFVNFFAFLGFSIWLGGEALSGKIERGHYFIGSHGRFREVSHATFVYSTIHGYAALIGLAVAGIASAHLEKISARP